MKRLVAALLVLISSVAFAQHRNPYGYGHHHHYHGKQWDWVAPAIIGGAVVYAITRPPVVVQQPPVVTLPPQDIVYIDGVPYRRQLMMVNGFYQEVLVRI